MAERSPPPLAPAKPVETVTTSKRARLVPAEAATVRPGRPTKHRRIAFSHHLPAGTATLLGEGRIPAITPGAPGYDLLCHRMPVAAACGPSVAAVVTHGGGLVTWGASDSPLTGRFGDARTPAAATCGGSCQQVACGRAHTVVLLQDGRVETFGDNGHRALGRRSGAIGRLPGQVLLPRGHVAVQVAAGADHTAIVTAGGAVFVCGRNTHHQLGVAVGPTAAVTLLPLPVGERALLVACGKRHTVVLCESGQVFGCGSNDHQQLGLGPHTPFVATPARIPALCGIGVSDLKCGSAHTLALTRSGRVWACGANQFGQTGCGSVGATIPAQQVPFFMDLEVNCIAAGDWHSFAETTDGTVYGFGSVVGAWCCPSQPWLTPPCRLNKTNQLGCEGTDRTEQQVFIPLRAPRLMAAPLHLLAAAQQTLVVFQPSQRRTVAERLAALHESGACTDTTLLSREHVEYHVHRVLVSRRCPALLERARPLVDTALVGTPCTGFLGATTAVPGGGAGAGGQALAAFASAFGLQRADSEDVTMDAAEDSADAFVERLEVALPAVVLSVLLDYLYSDELVSPGGDAEEATDALISIYEAATALSLPRLGALSLQVTRRDVLTLDSVPAVLKAALHKGTAPFRNLVLAFIEANYKQVMQRHSQSIAVALSGAPDVMATVLRFRVAQRVDFPAASAFGARAVTALDPKTRASLAPAATLASHLIVAVPPSTLAADVRSLLLHEASADVHIDFGSCRLPAHRFVLAAQSSFFRTMLSSTFTEGRSGDIALRHEPRLSAVAGQALLAVLYTGSTSHLQPWTALELLPYFQFLLLDGVDDLERIVAAALSLDTVYHILRAAQCHGLHALKSAACMFFARATAAAKASGRVLTSPGPMSRHGSHASASGSGAGAGVGAGAGTMVVDRHPAGASPTPDRSHGTGGWGVLVRDEHLSAALLDAVTAYQRLGLVSRGSVA